MASNSIGDFFIRLGVNYDDKDAKSFRKSMKDTQKSLDETSKAFVVLDVQARKTSATMRSTLGAITSATTKATFAISGLGAGAVFAGSRISKSLIDLSNLSSQTGASVDEIEVFRRQIEQVGGSAGQADSFVRSFAERIAQLRVFGTGSSPILARIFGTGGDIDNPVKALERVRDYLRDISKEERLVVAQDLGLSPELLSFLTLPQARFEQITARARSTAIADEDYIKRARSFQADFSALQTEFRRIKLDLFAGTSEEIKSVVRELREFLAEEDIRTILIEAIKKTSQLFQMLVRGFGGVLERISVAGQQLSEGNTLSAVQTLAIGTPQEVEQRRIRSERRAGLIRQARTLTDLSGTRAQGVFDSLERLGVSQIPVTEQLRGFTDTVRGLQGLPSLAQTQSALTARQATNNVNITNNFNNTTTSGEESIVTKNQIQQAIASNRGEVIN